MKFKIYNADNSKNCITGKKLVRISRTAGLITFSQAAAKMMQLQKDDRIEIAQDEDHPKDFYLHKTSNPSGFTLRTKTDDYGYSFNCSKIANLILDGRECKACSFMVGTAQMFDGIPYHLIITNKPINERK